MNGGLRLHRGYGNGVEFFQCENRSCQYGKIDDAYSWEHVTVLGWGLKEADIFRGKKASGANPDLMSSDGVLSELYCPACSVDFKR